MLRYLCLGLALAATASAANFARNDAEIVEKRAGVYLDEILASVPVLKTESVNTKIFAISHLVPDGRIVGGDVAPIEQYPWQLSLRRSLTHICGAVLISANWALSAAHCTQNVSVSQLTLLAGTENRIIGGVIRAVTRVINHPDYFRETFDNDISLIQVASGFPFSTSIRPVVLPHQGEDFPAGTYTWVTGWGTTHSGSQTLTNFLLQVAVPIVAQNICNRNYFNYITPQMVCAGYLEGGKDACQGDSGGPLVTGNGTLVGLVSWNRSCAAPKFPGVYTRVSAFRTWILLNAGV